MKGKNIKNLESLGRYSQLIMKRKSEQGIRKITHVDFNFKIPITNEESQNNKWSFASILKCRTSDESPQEYISNEHFSKMTAMMRFFVEKWIKSFNLKEELAKTPYLDLIFSDQKRLLWIFQSVWIPRLQCPNFIFYQKVI